MNDSTISLTYFIGGECLKKRGVYTVADVTVKNGFANNEVFILNKPSRTIEAAQYVYSQTSVTLGKSFVENCLTAPTKPRDENYHKWLRTPMGKLSQMWKKLSDLEKIKYHIDLYVKDMGGYEYTYEIL